MSTRLTHRTVEKTSDYTIKYPMDAPGTTFTNRGAAAGVTFTLPAPGRAVLGVPYRFVGVADQAITVRGPSSDQLVALNDAAATSIAASTADQLIGAVIEAECIKTGADTYGWAVAGVTVGVTYTVA
jgi:hypothetical protein